VNKADPISSITTVLLDADGVLQRSAGGFVSSLESLCENSDQRAEFIADIFRVEKPCLTGGEDFPSALGEVLARWDRGTPVSAALELWAQVNPAPEILGAVEELRGAGIRVGIASNQQAHRAGIMADHLGYRTRFDHLFFSCELGYAKPDARFFSAILLGLRASGNEVLFIDDHSQNVSSAREAGIRAELYHLDQGYDDFRSILAAHGLFVS
jgi:putative hydrolase of the HAD superfamily